MCSQCVRQRMYPSSLELDIAVDEVLTAELAARGEVSSELLNMHAPSLAAEPSDPVARVLELVIATFPASTTDLVLMLDGRLEAGDLAAALCAAPAARADMAGFLGDLCNKFRGLHARVRESVLQVRPRAHGDMHSRMRSRARPNARARWQDALSRVIAALRRPGTKVDGRDAWAVYAETVHANLAAPLQRDARVSPDVIAKVRKASWEPAATGGFTHGWCRSRRSSWSCPRACRRASSSTRCATTGGCRTTPRSRRRS